MVPAKQSCGSFTTESQRVESAEGFRSLLNDFGDGRFLSGTEYRHAGLDDAGFFSSNFRQSFAQILLVIQIHRRNHGRHRGHDIGRIQPPAQTGFEQHHIAFVPGKRFQRHDGNNFEKGRAGIGRKLTEPLLHGFHQRDHFSLGNVFAVDLDAFAEADQMRRGEEAGSVAGRAINTLQHRAHTAFAVGAGDVDDLKLFLRVVRERSQLAWIIQTELGAEQA